MTWVNAFDHAPMYPYAYGAGHGFFNFGGLPIGKGQTLTEIDNTDGGTLSVSVSAMGDVTFSTTASTLVAWKLEMQWFPPADTGKLGRVSNASFATGYTSSNVVNGDISTGPTVPFTTVHPATPNPIDITLASGGSFNGFGVSGA